MNRRALQLRRIVVMAFVALVAGCGSTSPTTSPASINASGSPEVPASSSLPPSSTSPSESPLASLQASPIPSTLTGDLTKAPFTVLVLGGDDGFRTDAVVVVGVDPVKRTITYASLPRDTIDLPLPGGGVFRAQKVNAFYNYAAADPGRYPQGPGRATADLIGTLLGIRIDFYAATTFSGFTNIVNAMGGIRVNVPRTVVDPFFQITRTNVGIRFNPGWQVMKGARALIYARTRQGDNDFERSRRQQVLLTAAGNQLLTRPALLVALVGAARNLITDFPLGQVPALIQAVGSVSPASITSGTVFGPTTYSRAAPCSCGYALLPNTAAIRKTAAKLFPWAVHR
jgi:LCP family protein required for cell wall assembly